MPPGCVLTPLRTEAVGGKPARLARSSRPSRKTQGSPNKRGFRRHVPARPTTCGRPYDGPVVARPPRKYTAVEVDAAVARLANPQRFDHATEIVTHAAPSLASVLDQALADGGWYGSAHEELLTRASAEPDPGERLAAVRALVDEQTRVGMLVGVAVGFELAGELAGIEPTNTEEN